MLTAEGTAWDMTKVDHMFSKDDAADIKQVAIGGPGRSDYLAWNHTKNGYFSVRSAYHMCMAMKRARSGWPEGQSPHLLSKRTRVGSGCGTQMRRGKQKFICGD